METAVAESLASLRKIVQKYWGYDSFRSLQAEAMQAALESRDSLVVLPTGGGKSLCYQAPAVFKDDELTVVVSPLISLMKDQVDTLKACGIAAAQLNSSLSSIDQLAVEHEILSGEIRLLYVSPERLVNPDFCRFLRQAHTRSFVIDEAHCISHWGHNFRPEYRQLSLLKEMFPGSSVHAYTATATESVRADIVKELNLSNPLVLVGNFDRPNLTYRVQSRRDVLKQTLEVVARHNKEAGIIYCIRRKEVDELASSLNKNKVKALPYHAGLDGRARHRAQEAFANEECDLIVATVAFGMGIDRSNVRYVLHTGMPKSLEHYQQETGRSGRDGLEAECVLLYSNGDVPLWLSIMERAALESESESDATSFENAQYLDASKQQLEHMSRYCRSAVCRHRILVEHFGQSYLANEESCQACDICLGETKPVADAQIIAQKIISCVARVKAPFGAGHIVSILKGENTEAVRKWQHEKLSTFGLLREHQKTEIRDWLDQLYGQGFLTFDRRTIQSGHAYNAVAINAESMKVLRGETLAKLYEPMRAGKDKAAKKKKGDAVALDSADQQLFEALRVLRRQLAQERGWQPYMVFSDVTLRELAQVRPADREAMRGIYGVGNAKLESFGETFLGIISQHAN